LAQPHIRHLEPQVTAVGEERGDQAAHQGLLRDRLASGLQARQVLGQQPAAAVDPDLEEVVRGKALQHVAKTPLLEHAHRTVLNQPGALALLDVSTGLPLEDDAVDAAGPQQRRGGQSGNTAPHDRDRRGLAQRWRHDVEW